MSPALSAPRRDRQSHTAKLPLERSSDSGIQSTLSLSHSTTTTRLYHFHQHHYPPHTLLRLRAVTASENPISSIRSPQFYPSKLYLCILVTSQTPARVLQSVLLSSATVPPNHFRAQGNHINYAPKPWTLQQTLRALRHPTVTAPYFGDRHVSAPVHVLALHLTSVPVRFCDSLSAETPDTESSWLQ